MHNLFRPLIGYIFRLGIFAPFAMGILDSSFLFLPFGNDVVVVALVSHHPDRILYYVLSAATGSTLGAFFIVWIAGRLGADGVRKLGGAKQVARLESRVKSRGALAVLLADIAPPPFPFTLVIATAAALKYPSRKILGVNFIGRAIRFTILGLLAMRFGSQVLKVANSDVFHVCMEIFVAVCLIGSGFSVWRWITRTRSHTKGKEARVT